LDPTEARVSGASPPNSHGPYFIERLYSEFKACLHLQTKLGRGSCKTGLTSTRRFTIRTPLKLSSLRPWMPAAASQCLLPSPTHPITQLCSYVFK